MSEGKIQDGDAGFVLGQNSALSPDQLPPGFYARGVNVVNRGGVVQCRPGYRCIANLPDGRLQGGTFFRPKVGPLVLIFGVDGLLYISDIPFRTYRQIPGVEFSSEAARLYFKAVELSNVVNSDGSITLVDKQNLLVIQDGGFSSPVVFNGTTAVAQRGAGKIPIGGPMEWVADRLWVANGASVFASDLGSPISFTETTYIAGAVPFFSLPQTVTSLTKTPSVELPQLLAFTGQSTTLFQAGIRDRSLWASTNEFQKEVFPKIGCVSDRSVTNHYGNLWWYSQFGYTSLDAAAQSNISSLVDYQDAEMQDSKARLSSDLSGIAATSHENYLLVSVPHADRFNRHTWVLDSTTLVTGERPIRSWNGVWTGTRPVQWITDNVNGVERTFYFSVDFDGMNRLWEAFIPDRLDNGCPITWWVEFRGLNLSFPGKFKRFRYAELFLSELAGLVDVAVFYAGSYRGRFKKILTKRILATRGSLRSGETVSAGSKIFALKKQSRPIRTQDAKAIHGDFTLSSCDVEAPFEEFLDENFQILVVGSGPGAVRGYIAYAEPPDNLDDAGKCEEDETEENFVRFDGAASEAAEFPDALSEFEGDIPKFTSVQWETLNQMGMTEIARGEAESIISQANADHVARVIARRTAAEALQAVAPRIVSLGSLANDLAM